MTGDPGTMLPHEWFGRAVPPNVELDPTCWIYSSYAFLHYRSRRRRAVRIGANTGVYANTMFDLGVEGEVRIGPYCTIVAPVFATNGLVLIEDHVLISSSVVIADDPHATPAARAQGSTGVTEPTDREPVVTISSGAWIGTGCTLLAGAHIGRDAVVGAGTVVDGVVPAGAVVGGNPWRIVRSIS